jgi:hypothetical protein
MKPSKLAIAFAMIFQLHIAAVWALLETQGPEQKTDIKQKLVYIWYPRSTDVPAAATAPESILLKSILDLVTLKEHVVQSGETLDSIIINNFYVSAQFHNAYQLYVERVKALNPVIADINRLKVGLILKLPTGPKYSITQIGSQDLPEAIKQKVFSNLSGKAYFGPSNQDKVHTSALSDKVSSSLGYIFQNASKTLSSNEVLIKAEALGLVPAIDLETHPETALAQAQTLQIESNGSPASQMTLNNLIANEKRGGLLPATVPEVTSATVDCAGHCDKCADILAIPAGTDLSRARLLVTDTGLNLTALHNPHIKYLSVQDQQNISDISSEQHGTFVFSEMSSSGAGPIPDSQIYVSRVATGSGGSVTFDVASVLDAWTNYSATEEAINGLEPMTWIANISAEGGSAPGTKPDPAIPYDSHLLVVAAAGNGASGSTTSTDIFPRLSSQNSSLIIVGALSVDGVKAAYSNWDRTNIQLFARGDCVCGVGSQLNGTSQAAPLVSIAAATLASVRNQWYSRQVMWRLLSTADRPPILRNLALSGVVNLPRALSPGIKLRYDGPNPGNVTEITGMQIQFDQEWVTKINNVSADIDPKVNALLRVTDRFVNDGGMDCFTLVRYLSFPTSQVCVLPTATVTLKGNPNPIAASFLEDIFLPMSTDQQGVLPVITAIR